MHLDELRKLYRDLPTSQRERWATFESFRAQSTGIQHLDLAFDGISEANAKAKSRLPRALEENEFGGLASAFNVKIDAWMPSYIEPGAFKHTLADPTERSRVKVLYQHYQPLGKPKFMEEVQEGLLVIGAVSQTQLGKDVITHIRDEVIDEMSIGFDPVEFVFRENPEKELSRYISKVRLWEFSPVTFGANRGAKITDVNSFLGMDIDRIVALVTAKMAHALPEKIERLEVGSPQELVEKEIERLRGLLPKKEEQAVVIDIAPYLEQLAQLEQLSLS